MAGAEQGHRQSLAKAHAHGARVAVGALTFNRCLLGRVSVGPGMLQKKVIFLQKWPSDISKSVFLRTERNAALYLKRIERCSCLETKPSDEPPCC
jgi:hypothetical protein